MAVNITVQRKIRVNGKDYDGLNDVPPDVRTEMEHALDAGTAITGTVTINGKTYASMDDVPAPLKFLIREATSMALKRAQPASSAMNEPVAASLSPSDAVRPEPSISTKKLVLAAAAGALLFFLARWLF